MEKTKKNYSINILGYYFIMNKIYIKDNKVDIKKLVYSNDWSFKIFFLFFYLLNVRQNDKIRA